MPPLIKLKSSYSQSVDQAKQETNWRIITTSFSQDWKIIWWSFQLDPSQNVKWSKYRKISDCKVLLFEGIDQWYQIGGQLNLNVVNLDLITTERPELENKNKAIEYFRIYGGWEIWPNIQMRYNKPAQVNAGGRVYTRLAFILMEQQQNNFFC